MDKLQVSLELSRDRVLHGTNDLGTCRIVGEDREVCIEELVRLVDRDRELEPVSSGGDRARLKIVLLQPRVDSRYSFRRGSDEFLDLLTTVA